MFFTTKTLAKKAVKEERVGINMAFFYHVHTFFTQARKGTLREVLSRARPNDFDDESLDATSGGGAEDNNNNANESPPPHQADKSQFKIDFPFQIAFINDIIHGMMYIQRTELRSHGALTSLSCYV